MCKHQMVKVNDVRVCVKCGMTLVDNRVVFDKKLAERIKAKKKTHRRKRT